MDIGRFGWAVMDISFDLVIAVEFDVVVIVGRCVAQASTHDMKLKA
jgi:hypothetical protein